MKMGSKSVFLKIFGAFSLFYLLPSVLGNKIEGSLSDDVPSAKEMAITANTSGHENDYVLQSLRHVSSDNDLMARQQHIRDINDWSVKELNTIIIPASFNSSYDESVNISNQFVFIYSYTETNKTTAVRILVSCSGANNTYPVMFSARKQEGILAWTVPLDIGDSYSYMSVSHTLCPINKLHRQHMAKHQRIFVDVSSANPFNSKFHLSARLLDNFELSHNTFRPVTVVTAEPQYFMYMFPDGVDQVLLRVTSKSKECMTVSVQNIKCPVLDLENNIEFKGKHQTMITQAAIFLQRSDFDKIKGFYVVLLLRSNDVKCVGKLKLYNVVPPTDVKPREKTVEIVITKATTTKQYIIATLTVVGILFGFYLFAGVMGLVYTSCGFYKALDDLTPEERDSLLPGEAWLESHDPRPTNEQGTGDEQDTINAHPHRGYGAIRSENEDEDDNRPGRELGYVPPIIVRNSNGSSSSLYETNSLNEDEIDFLPDAESERDETTNKGFKFQMAMFVSDLSRKKKSKLKKYFNLYLWNLMALAIFYALPVVQLVLTYQTVMFQSGNEDLCYYNFACANPLRPYISSFNNVFSNIGYVMLGLLFIIIVRSRHILHEKALKKHGDVVLKLGIPQYYGTFYAMGFALFMEGIMSGCYHVCPNYSDFQFDTSFMYIIACLCMLRIYQNRHVDITTKAHTAYCSMALVIFVAVAGVVYGTNIFWIFYALVHIFFTFVLTLQVYFLGRWKMGWSFFKHFIQDFGTCSRPESLSRFIMLVIGNVINWACALYGSITQPSDFASFLLAIFIGNLLLYCLFYVMMKLLNGEKISLLVTGVMLMSLVTWGAALSFFFQHLTSWQETPSGSREGNKSCIWLSFYDSHDVWHLLSAFSLFFSFMILLLLDDDLSLKPQTKIPVF